MLPRLTVALRHRSVHDRSSGTSVGFTILELLVSIAVLVIFVLMLSTITDSSFKLWRSTQSSIMMFDSARAAYDTMTRRISRATLNTRLDYYDKDWIRRDPTNSAAFVPALFGRSSDLDFISSNASGILGGAQQGQGVFFFAPLGFTAGNSTYTDLPKVLNAAGYYVEFGSDKSLRPDFLADLPEKYRYRLIEDILPAQSFKPSTANGTDNGYPAFTDIDTGNDKAWIKKGLLGTDSKKHVLAENVIALIIRPEVSAQDAGSLGLVKSYSLTSDYTYDSRADRSQTPLQFAQLPPLLRVILVAVDDKSARRLTTGDSPPAAFQLDKKWFVDPSKLDDDLASISKQLTDAGVQFRIFNQTIALKGAKFSSQKEN